MRFESFNDFLIYNDTDLMTFSTRLAECRKDHPFFPSNFFDFLLLQKKNNQFEKMIDEAFSWSFTPEGFECWKRVHFSWRRFYAANRIEIEKDMMKFFFSSLDNCVQLWAMNLEKIKESLEEKNEFNEEIL